MAHGGKRAGAGRKQLPDEQQKKALSIKIDPELREYLRQCTNGTAAIEAAIRGTKAFKEWKRGRNM